MRGLLAFACRAFPRDYRARRSGELVDTALLTADGSAWRAALEAVSLVVAGLRQRLRAEAAATSVRDGLWLLAAVIALVNLAVALYGIAAAVDPPVNVGGIRWSARAPFRDPYVVDWWWIAFALAAAGVVLGLALGYRRLAVGAALANLGIVGYDALFLPPANFPDYFRGHLIAIAFLRGPDGYPIGQQWLAPAIVLALATAAAPLRRRSLSVLPVAFVAAALLVVVARETLSGFLFLGWPLAAVVVLAMVFGWLAPRIAVVAIGVSLAVAPSAVQYLSGPSWAYRDPVVTWVAAPGLALGIVLPLAYLARRRLT